MNVRQEFETAPPEFGDTKATETQINEWEQENLKPCPNCKQIRYFCNCAPRL